MKKATFLFVLTLLLPTLLFSQQLELPYYTSSEQIINHTGYTLCYSEKYEQAKWVAYELTIEELRGNVDITDNFRADSKVDTKSASLSDYSGSGYDRGHLAPAADFKWSEQAMRDTFYMSNMSPQKPGFNRGIWRKLESEVRDWVLRDKVLLVVTGPIFNGGALGYIGDDRVAIPTHYFKAILDYREPELKGIAFILPHESSSRPLSSFAVSIDQLEQITRIDFYHSLHDSIEEELESSFNVSLWDFDGNYSVEKRETGSSNGGSKNVEGTGTYWINSNNNTRHNSGCRYYGNTSNGYFTDEKIGKACGICGG